jgi:hypothetical protein
VPHSTFAADMGLADMGLADKGSEQAEVVEHTELKSAV